MTRFVLGLLLLVMPDRVHAEGLVPRNVDALQQIAPSARERHAIRARELERAAERLLQTVPGVLRAAASVQLPDPALVPLDQALPHPRLVVAVTATEATVDEALLRRLIEGLAAPPQWTLQLSLTREQRATVSKQSGLGPQASLLRQLLGVSLAANVLLATILLARFKREAAPVRDSARGR
jgi:hypothetical protein